MTISKRRGAASYRDPADDEELAAPADAAKAAAERAGAAIDRALEFIEASNRRIDAMEARTRRSRGKRRQ